MTDTLQQAQAALKSGNKEAGKKILSRVLRDDPHNEAAWLWMAYAADSEEQRRECLERVLAINPKNKSAQAALAELNSAGPAPAPTPSPPPQKASPPPSPSLALVPADAVAAPTATIPYQAGEEKGRWAGLFLPWWLILLAAAAGLVYQAGLIEQWNRLIQFSQSGVTGYAEVIDTWQDEQDHYFVVYSFEAGGAEGDSLSLQKEAEISPAFYNSLEPGQFIRVQYLFDNPHVARLNSSNITVLILLTLVALAAGAAGLWGAIRPLGRWLGQSRSLFQRAPAKPQVVWEGEGPPPLKQWSGTYTLGQDGYEGFFIIETEDGTFLGEGGMEILKVIPDTDPKQVIAFDVGIFDKTDLTTLSRALMSETAYHDDTVRTEIEAKPLTEAILAQPGAAFTMESTAMRVEAKIDDLVYGANGKSYFKELTVSLAIFVKDGIDLEKPMEVPDQFK